MTEPPNTEALLATVRRGIGVYEHGSHTHLCVDARAALDELKRRAEEIDPFMLEAVNVQVERAEAAEAELKRVRAERDGLTGRNQFLSTEVLRLDVLQGVAQARLDRAVEALRVAQSLQPERMKWFREQGVVFDKAPGPVADVTPEHSDYWQHVAFAVYTDLCEVETVARAALTEIEESP